MIAAWPRSGYLGKICVRVLRDSLAESLSERQCVSAEPGGCAAVPHEPMAEELTAAVIQVSSRRDSPSRLVRISDEALTREGPPRGAEDWKAFYSTPLGGATTAHWLMQAPLDDHMVHRGHAVFDTCNIAGGTVYGLDFHLDRFLRSADLARIDHDYSKEELREIVLRTIALSGIREQGMGRMWLSAGRGNYGISPRTCESATLYVVVIHYPGKKALVNGVAEFTVDVPAKPKLLANMKSNNYMINALTTMASEDRGGFLGLQVDKSGEILESSIANIAIVDQEGVLRTPEVDLILAGTTVKRAMALCEEHLMSGPDPLITGTEYAPITVDDAQNAREIIGFGGGFAYPVTSLNGRQIGNGTPGPVFQRLNPLVIEELKNPEFSDPIPTQWCETEIASLERSSRRQSPSSGSRCGGAVAKPACCARLHKMLPLLTLGVGLVLGGMFFPKARCMWAALFRGAAPRECPMHNK